MIPLQEIMRPTNWATVPSYNTITRAAKQVSAIFFSLSKYPVNDDEVTLSIFQDVVKSMH